MTIPPRPNFAKESDEYFVHAYMRLIQFQTPNVSMRNWRLDHVQNDLGAIMTDWQNKDLGTLVDQREALGGRTTEFVFNPNGVARGKQMVAAIKSKNRNRKFRKQVAKFLNSLAPWVSAIAALAAAYFSYEGLQNQ